EPLDEPPDAVVGESAIEGLDERRGGEVADPEAGPDRGLAEPEQDMALAGAGRADEDDVLARPDPLQRREVVERRARDRGLGDGELVERLGDREAGGPAAGPLVRLVAGGDLGLDERTEELVRRPALGSGRHEQLWRELADRAELEPLESGGEVGRQRCGGAAHRRSS